MPSTVPHFITLTTGLERKAAAAQAQLQAVEPESVL